MRSLYIIFAVFLLCNIAVTGATSFDLHPQQHGMLSADTIDTVARRDSMAVDSLVKDGVAVDSLAKDSVAVVDSIITAPAKKRVYVHFKEKPQPDSDQKKVKGFIALYKKNLSQKTIDGYVSAYTPWKGAFESCNQRTLDMYMDGIAILDCMVRKDTANRKYDKLTERREQMMELYDLAVDNIADLNAQIDRKRTADTLSVAKLRAAQFYKYRDCWVLDSIFNSKDTLHNKHNDQNIAYWKDTIFLRDSVNKELLYPILKDIVYSNDNNIDRQGYNMYLFYSVLLYQKYAPIVKINKAKGNLQYIDKHLKPEVDSIIAYVEKRYFDYQNTFYTFIPKTNKDYAKYITYSKNREKEIGTNLIQIEGLFIDKNDFVTIEKNYNERMANAKNNDEAMSIIDEMLKSSLKNAPYSELYYIGLKTIRKNTPFFDETLAVANYAYKAGNALNREYKVNKEDSILEKMRELYKDARDYYNNVIKECQFEMSELENDEKIKIYNKRAHSHYLSFIDIKKGKFSESKNFLIYIRYMKEFIDVSPDDYKAYYDCGKSFYSHTEFCYKGKGNYVTQRAAYWFAYDLFSKAEEKFNIQKADTVKFPTNEADSIIKNIRQYKASAYSNFPERGLASQKVGGIQNIEKTQYPSSISGFTTIIRCKD